MSHTTELERFHQFVNERLQSGERQLTPEEALDRFRSELPDDTELAESVPALRRALEQADRGEGIPLDEAMSRLRQEFNLPKVAADE